MRLPAPSTALRVGGVAIAMVLVAALAALALAPREEILEPVAVDAADYLGAEDIEGAEQYRGGQRRLFLIGMGLEAALLVTIALGRPARARRALERAAKRPLLGGALVGAATALLIAAATLPTRLGAHERAVDAGISTQSLSSWAWDVARSAGITAVLTGGGTLLMIALIRRFPRKWWLPGAAGVTVLAIVFTWIAPVVLAPVFNDFEPLPSNSRTRSDVLFLGERADVEIGEVYSIDASRRGTSLNAYVDGIGPTKRVVLYDNLIADAERPELNSVVAHELGHVANRDIPRGILFVALAAPLGLLFVRELGEALARRAGFDPRSPAAIPGYLLAIPIATLAINVPANQLSRDVERSADDFALELTEDSGALRDLQVRLARSNLSDPDPPGWVTLLFGTHPPTAERIGAALAFERQAGTNRALSEMSRP